MRRNAGYCRGNTGIIVNPVKGFRPNAATFSNRSGLAATVLETVSSEAVESARVN